MRGIAWMLAVLFREAPAIPWWGIAWMLTVLFREAPAIPWWGIAWMPALFFGEAPPIPRAETVIMIRIIVVPLKRGRFWRVLMGLRKLLGRFLGGSRGSGFLSAELFGQRLVKFLKIFDDRCWR